MPNLIGTFGELYTVKEMWRYKRRSIVIAGILPQAILWLFMILVGVLYFVLGVNSTISSMLLILIYTLLIGVDVAVTPVWTSWMKDLVIKDQGKYFGKRNEYVGIITLVCLLCAGFILDYFKHTYIFIGFAIIFFFAFIGRSISTYYFTKQYEPYLKVDKEYYFTFGKFIKNAPKNNFGKFVIFGGIFQFAVSIASPFFAVYILKQLNFSYIWYTLIIVANLVCRLVFMPIWGKFADKYGNISVITITAKLIPLIPALYFISIFLFPISAILTLCYLIFVEALSGICWAGFDLCTSDYIYDAVSREKMALCVTYYNLIGNSGIFIGTVIGGILATLSYTFGIITPVLGVILLSATLRFLSAYFFLPQLGEVRKNIKQFKLDLELKQELKIISPKNILEHLHFKIKHN